MLFPCLCSRSNPFYCIWALERYEWNCSANTHHARIRTLVSASSVHRNRSFSVQLIRHHLVSSYLPRQCAIRNNKQLLHFQFRVLFFPACPTFVAPCCCCCCSSHFHRMGPFGKAICGCVICPSWYLSRSHSWSVYAKASASIDGTLWNPLWVASGADEGTSAG